MNDRLYRSRDDRILGGVCSGIADRLDIDPSLVRVLWVIGTIFTGFIFGLLLYVLLLIVVPEAPEGWSPGGPQGYAPPPPPAPGSMPGWTPPDAESGIAPTTAGIIAAADASATASGSETGDMPSGDPGSGAPGWTPPSADPSVPQGSWTAPGAAPAPGTAPAPGSDAWLAADAAYASRRRERRARSRRNERSVGIVFGVLLILLGVWFLVREYLPQVDVDRFWPVLIIGVGVVLLVAAFAGSRGRGESGGPTA